MKNYKWNMVSFSSLKYVAVALLLSSLVACGGAVGGGDGGGGVQLPGICPDGSPVPMCLDYVGNDCGC